MNYHCYHSLSVLHYSWAPFLASLIWLFFSIPLRIVCLLSALAFLSMNVACAVIVHQEEFSVVSIVMKLNAFNEEVSGAPAAFYRNKQAVRCSAEKRVPRDSDVFIETNKQSSAAAF